MKTKKMELHVDLISGTLWVSNLFYFVCLFVFLKLDVVIFLLIFFKVHLTVV